jgi:hypothetical protein
MPGFCQSMVLALNELVDCMAPPGPPVYTRNPGL